MSAMNLEIWAGANLPATPGVYSVPTGQPTTLPESNGYLKRRDVGNYRLCSRTGRNGVVTNWQRELPDGEWREVESFLEHGITSL